MRILLILALVSGSLFAQSLRLADVRKIYIDKMPNDLDEYLRSAISKKFHSRLTIVLDRAQADAILGGVNLTAQQTQNATISLTDPKSQVVLWSGTAGDRSAKFLDLKHGGQEKVADHLIGQLKKAMER